MDFTAPSSYFVIYSGIVVLGAVAAAYFLAGPRKPAPVANQPTPTVGALDPGTGDLLNSPNPSLQIDALRKLLQLSEAIVEVTEGSPFPTETFVRVIQLLGADDADSEVQRKGVLFLGNCAISPLLRRTVVENNGLPSVLKVLHSKNGAVVEAASYALINLSINCENNSTAWSAVVTDTLRRLVVLLQHERRDIKFNVLRVLLNFSNDPKLRLPISDAQPYGFFKTLMLGNDEEILYKVAQVLGNLSDRTGGPVQRAVASSGCLEYLVSLLDGKPGPVLEMTLVTLEKLADHCRQVGQVIARENGLPSVYCLLNDKNEEIALKAIYLLGTIGTDEWNQAEQLRAMLTRGSYSARINAAVQAALSAIAAAGPPQPAEMEEERPSGRTRSRAVRVTAAEPGQSIQELLDGQKKVPTRESKRFRFGLAETIGRRSTMEDVTLVYGEFRDCPTEDLVAVFDGHGGKKCADFASSQIVAVLTDRLGKAGVQVGGPYDHKLVSTCLIEAFTLIHDDMLSQAWSHNCGTTVAIALALGDTLFTANVGDSRSVLVRGGKATRLSVDHKPQLPEETDRITKKGGFVRNKRVNGVLAVSRALGDGSLHPLVSPEPYVAITQLSPSAAPELLVLACDGVWDVMTDQDSADLLMPVAGDATTAALLLKDKAFSLNSLDNISVAIWILSPLKTAGPAPAAAEGSSH